MTYVIYKNNKYIEHTFETIEETLVNLNKYLTEHKVIKYEVGNCKYFDKYKKKDIIMHTWVTDDGIVGLIHINGLEYCHMPYFLLPSTKLSDTHYVKNLINLYPHTVVDVIINYNISNVPSIFLYFGIHEHYLQQAFVVYLNKTISKVNETENTNLTQIAKDFVKDDNVDLSPYNKILLFYLRARDIPPFMVKYNP